MAGVDIPFNLGMNVAGLGDPVTILFFLLLAFVGVGLLVAVIITFVNRSLMFPWKIDVRNWKTGLLKSYKFSAVIFVRRHDGIFQDYDRWGTFLEGGENILRLKKTGFTMTMPDYKDVFIGNRIYLYADSPAEIYPVVIEKLGEVGANLMKAKLPTTKGLQPLFINPETLTLKAQINYDAKARAFNQARNDVQQFTKPDIWDRWMPVVTILLMCIFMLAGVFIIAKMNADQQAQVGGTIANVGEKLVDVMKQTCPGPTPPPA